MAERTFLLDFTEAKEVPDFGFDLYDCTYNGIETYPRAAIELSMFGSIEDAPIPWDTSPDIDGDDLIMNGGFGPSGYGSMSISFPKKDAKQYYRFEMTEHTGEDPDGSKLKKILEMLAEAGIKVSEKGDE